MVRKRANILVRVLLLSLFLFLIPLFMSNAIWLLSRDSVDYLISRRWWLVGFYILLFSAFSIFLVFPFRRNRWQKSTAWYVAFIIALFTEMFGFPLTIYLLSSFVDLPRIEPLPRFAFSFELFGFTYYLLLTSLIASIISVVAGLLIILGWIQIYKNRGGLVTSGIYAYVRHPQYLGIFLIITAWLIAWPTLPTLIMWPVLMIAYYRLAKREDAEIEKKFGKEFLKYKREVPMFLPF